MWDNVALAIGSVASMLKRGKSEDRNSGSALRGRSYRHDAIATHNFTLHAV
jgi:hypothetical protein